MMQGEGMQHCGCTTEYTCPFHKQLNLKGGDA
jgi:hypothetical protein